MTAAPLAVLVGLKVPHPPLVLLPQVADQLKMPFPGSLLTVAVRDSVALIVKEVGVGVGTVLRSMVGWLEPEWVLTQATDKAIVPRVNRRRMNLERFILGKVLSGRALPTRVRAGNDFEG